MIPSECFLNFADSWICTWVLNYSGNIFNLRKSIISLCIFARGYNKSITVGLIDFTGKVIEIIILIIYFIFDFDGTSFILWILRIIFIFFRIPIGSQSSHFFWIFFHWSSSLSGFWAFLQYQVDVEINGTVEN